MHEPGHTKRQFLSLAGATGLVPGVARAAAGGGPLRVLAAASLQNALQDVATAFVRTGGARPQLSFAGSSVLARQIAEGAPADVFISADEQWMDALAAKGLIAPGGRSDVLTNRLALIAPSGSPVKIVLTQGAPLRAALGEGRLAMAGASVPAGLYGEAALKTLKVWSSVADRIVRAENVRAALAFVADGDAPLGIVYETDARIEPRVRVVGLFPETSHPKILYPAALIREARPGARDFLAFLRSPAARRIFGRYGFGAA